MTRRPRSPEPAEPARGRVPDARKLQPALARLLRPLVRLLIRSGITFPMLGDLLRELYVNVAEYDFALENKEQTDSRVSLLTGIHRKEVRRLRGAGAPVNTVPAALSRTSRILARWMAAPAFTDGAGAPLPLPRGGVEVSFEALVESVTRDVRPRAVLDEWLDRKLVRLDDDDRVVLLEAAVIPRDDDHQLFYLGRNLHDHVAAAVTNVLAPQPRFFERAVHYDRLPAGTAAALEQKARLLALQALQQANRDAHAAAETDESGTWRWNFGIYIYAEDDEAATSPSPAASSGAAK